MDSLRPLDGPSECRPRKYLKKTYEFCIYNNQNRLKFIISSVCRFNIMWRPQNLKQSPKTFLDSLKGQLISEWNFHRAEICLKFGCFLGDLTAARFHSEINWHLSNVKLFFWHFYGLLRIYSSVNSLKNNCKKWFLTKL